MTPPTDRRHTEPPDADRRFCEILMPYEIRLAQRRTMVHETVNPNEPATSHLGLFVVRVEPPGWAAETTDHGELDNIDRHVQDLMKTAIRDSDIPCYLGRRQHLAIARDLDADHAYVVAQRLLGAASRSDFLDASNVNVFVGYVVYPLSSPPNFPVQDWTSLVTLAHKLAKRDPSGERTSGFGLISGPGARGAGMPEAELIPVALDDPEPLLEAEVLTLQRIRIMH